MANSPIDRASIARATAGDDGARQAIAETYRSRVLRYITTMIGDADLGDDLTQECFAKAFAKLADLRDPARLGEGLGEALLGQVVAEAFAKLADLRDPARLGAWIFAIAVNLCRAHLKKLVDGGTTRELPSDPVGARRSVLSHFVERESAAALAVAIDRLPILLREAFVLHLVEGLPYAEIATITGASPEALHVRAHRAKALLRRQLGPVVDTFWAE